ncbi:MAG: hypothetical protein RLZZ450_2970 [Pseudomonadota bacterium]|jgi:hypothetical protein
MKRRKLLQTALLSTAAVVGLGTSGLLMSAQADGATITAQNWGESVSFKPDLTALKIPVGTMITKANVDQVKALLPPGLDTLVRKYELKMKIAAYTPIRPSLSYIKATNDNMGKTKAWDVGKDYRKAGWSGYIGGLPFPKPKDGLQLAYNFLNTYTGDDADRFYDVTWISGKRGIETTEYWHWLSMRTANRTDIDPRPTIPEFAAERTRAVSITLALEPYDKQGFGALYFNSLDPVDLTGHVYVPAMRRVLRQSFGTRGDSWNATDFLYEDVGGYLGAAEWMNWKIVGQKTMLLPTVANAKYGKDVKAVFDVDNAPHWNPKVDWQPRPVYLLEVTPKIPDYPYSRMLLMVDAETFSIPYKEAYDKKGELWKIILGGGNPSTDANSKPMMPGFALAIDLQAEHASAVTMRKVTINGKLDPAQFSVSNLKKRGH